MKCFVDNNNKYNSGSVFPAAVSINAVRSVTSGVKKSFSNEIFKHTRILKMKENV